MGDEREVGEMISDLACISRFSIFLLPPIILSKRTMISFIGKPGEYMVST